MHLEWWQPSLVAAFIIGCLFAATAAAKWMNLRWFAGIVKGYDLLPSPWFTPAAFVVVLAESSVPVLLLVGRSLAASAIACIALSVFSFAIWVNLHRGRVNVSCGCGGHMPQRISTSMIWRNLALCAIAVVAARPTVPVVVSTLVLLVASLVVAMAFTADTKPAKVETAPQIAMS